MSGAPAPRRYPRSFDVFRDAILRVASGTPVSRSLPDPRQARRVDSWLSAMGVRVAELRGIGPDEPRLREILQDRPRRRPAKAGKLDVAKLDRPSAKAVEELRSGAMPGTVARLVNLPRARVEALSAQLKSEER